MTRIAVLQMTAGIDPAANACTIVEAAWQAVLRRNGLSKESRVGYSVGLSFPPDWGERTVSLRPGDKIKLAAAPIAQP